MHAHLFFFFFFSLFLKKKEAHLLANVAVANRLDNENSHLVILFDECNTQVVLYETINSSKITGQIDC